jgi:hypothetical protein
VEGADAKLHEMGKHLEVSETGMAGNATLQKWKCRGKHRIYMYKNIYIFKKKTLSCKKDIMTDINDIKNPKP